MFKISHLRVLFLTLVVILGFFSPVYGQYTPLVGDISVTNFNTRLDRVTGEKTIKIVRITMDGKTTPEMSTLVNQVAQANATYITISRGRYRINLIDTSTVDVPPGGCTRGGEARQLAHEHADTRPDTFITMFRWPNNVCSYSNAGSGSAWLKTNSVRTLLHELGHLMGLKHSQRLSDININKDKIVPFCFLGGKMEVECSDPERVEYGDYTSFMGGGGTPLAYAVPQLHWLGWTEEHDVVKINDSLDYYGYVEVPIRPIGDNPAGDIPLTYVYEIPGTDQRLWVGIAKPGQDIFVWHSPTRKGFKHVNSGMLMDSIRVGQINDPQNPGPRECAGLVIDPLYYSNEMAILRISLAGKPFDFPGDIDRDRNVDRGDLRILSENWLLNNYHSRSIGETLGRWNFDQAGGGVALDISANGNDATLYGDAQWTDGAISLDGGGDYLETAVNSDKLQLTESYTISVKLKAASEQTDGASILSKAGHGPGIPPNYWSLGPGYYDLAGKIVMTNGFNNWDTGISLDQIAGTWHKIAVVYGEGLISSYLNGQLVKHERFEHLPGSGEGSLKIGCDRHKFRFFAGQIDDIVILDYELKPGEVSGLHQDGLISLETSLAGRWDFEDHAVDASGSGHDGVVHGTPSWPDMGDDFGTVVSFNRVDNYITIPNFDYTNQSHEFSVSLWFKLDNISGSGYQYVFSHGEDMQPNNLDIYIRNIDSSDPGAITTRLQLSEGSRWQVTSPSAVADGQWHLYTLTVDSSAGAKIYIDALEILSNSAIKGSAFEPIGDIYLAARNDLLSDRYYGSPLISDGLLDDVRIYRCGLLADQVTELYNGEDAGVSDVICVAGPKGDFNQDCKVDFKDFVTLAENWLRSF